MESEFIGDEVAQLHRFQFQSPSPFVLPLFPPSSSLSPSPSFPQHSPMCFFFCGTFMVQSWSRQLQRGKLRQWIASSDEHSFKRPFVPQVPLDLPLESEGFQVFQQKMAPQSPEALFVQVHYNCECAHGPHNLGSHWITAEGSRDVSEGLPQKPSQVCLGRNGSQIRLNSKYFITVPQMPCVPGLNMCMG